MVCISMKKTNKKGMVIMLKKILLAWGTDLKKIVTGMLFPIAVLVTFAIFLSGVIYRTETGRTYNAVTMLLHFTGEEIAGKVSRYEVCQYGGAGIWVYAPLVVLLPLIPMLVMERTGGSRRYQIMRTGKIPFAVGKMLTTLLAGGMVLPCGFLLFTMYVSVFFPVGGEPVQAAFLMDSAWRYFLYGAVLSVPGYAAAAVMKNIYLVYCIPFIVNYLWDMGLSDLKLFMEPGKVHDMITALLNMCAFYLRGWSERTTRYFIVLHVLFVVMAAAGYVFYLEKKTDCGD